jgi:hypothetical protein
MQMKTTEMQLLEFQRGQPIEQLIFNWLSEGWSLRAIGRELNVSSATMGRWVRLLGIEQEWKWTPGGNDSESLGGARKAGAGSEGA